MGLKDDMWRLEAKGMESDVKEREAAGARQQNIMFVRGETQVPAASIFRIDVTWLLCSAKDGWNNLRCPVFCEYRTVIFSEREWLLGPLK
jgi:hypothetical protein